jgi:MFS family permease
MMIASSTLSAGAALVFARLMKRWSPARSLAVSLVAFAVCSVSSALLSASYPRPVAAAFYLLIAVFGAVLLSGFWSVVNERFDPYSARRAMGKIGLGTTLGGVAGGGLAWLVSQVFAVGVALAALAVTSLACVFLLRWLADGSSSAAVPEDAAEDDLAPGLGVLRRTPYLRDLGLLVLVLALVDAILDFALKSEAASRYSGREALFGFFSSYAALVGLGTFLSQLALARPALIGLGLGGTLALQPGTTFVLAVIGLFHPTVLTVALARGGTSSFRDSLFRSAYELLYTPLPTALKRQAKAVVDVVFDRVGTILGSLVVLAAGLLPLRPVPALLVLAAGLAIVALSICQRLHGGYVRALESNLRSGAVKLDSEELLDGTTLAISRATLGIDRAMLLQEVRARAAAEASAAEKVAEPVPPVQDPVALAVVELRSGSPARVRAVLSAPGPLDPALVAHAIPMLGQRDVAAEVIRALRPLAGRVTGQLVDTLLDREAETVVRRRVVRILKVSPNPRAVEGLILGLSDPELSVRVECGKTLAAVRSADPGIPLRADLVQAAALVELRAARSGPLDPAAVDHVFTLLSLVLDAEPVLISLQALRGDNPRLRGTALEYLENVLPREMREALWPTLGIAPAPKPASRAPEEMVDELLQSAADGSPELRRALLRPRRPTDD